MLRLQSSGKQVESNDVLTFDFVDSFEVARCLGGARRADGSADFDEGSCVPITRERDGALVPGALLRISPETPVRAYFMPRATCPATLTDPPRNYVATAVSTWPPGAPPPPSPPPSAPGGGSVPARPAGAPAGWASWLELVAFGKAQGWRGQPCRDDECVRNRRAFEVEFGDRVEATGFDLLMMDDRFVKRLRRGEPPGTPEILGRLVGEFELRLARGQGAQTFP